MIAREQLKLLLNSDVHLDNDDLIYFCHKVIVECEQQRMDEISAKSILDASYTPLSISNDYFICLDGTGAGSKVDKLPEDPVGEIADLIYFSSRYRQKRFSNRVPDSYFNLGKDPGGFTLDDLGAEE